MKVIRHTTVWVLCLAGLLWWWHIPPAKDPLPSGTSPFSASLEQIRQAGGQNRRSGDGQSEQMTSSVEETAANQTHQPSKMLTDAGATSLGAMLPEVHPLAKSGLPPSVEPHSAGSAGPVRNNPTPIGREKGSKGPVRTFVVPSNLVERALPIFVLELDAAPMTADSPGGKALPTGTEEQAIRKAGKLFFEGLDAAPTHEENDPEYEAWWEASQIRSEEMLKALLGWDRYNLLNAEAARKQYNSLRDEPTPSSF